ncbi:MAG: hypothetical protein WD871_04480 [Xanthobacteraceae bacterium]
MTGEQKEKLRHRELVFPSGLRAELWLEIGDTHVTMHEKRATGGGGRNWPKCNVGGCCGQAIQIGGSCIAHLAESERDRYLQGIRFSSEALYLCGVNITPALLDKILQVVVRDGRSIRRYISFEGAEIDAPLRFNDFNFESEINFTGATFYKPVEFNRCVFSKGFFAQYIRLIGPALDLAHSKIEGRYFDVSYSSCDLNGVRISNCEFGDSVRADGNALKAFRLEECDVRGDLSINDASPIFIMLAGTNVEGECRIENTKCSTFQAPRFKAAAANHIGPLKVDHDCNLDRAKFQSRLTLDVNAGSLNLQNSQFLAGGNIYVDRAIVRLRQLSAGRVTRISGKPMSEKTAEIIDIGGADAGQLALAHVNMSRCAFYGTHDLSRIVIEPTVRFSFSPSWLRKRKCIADEFGWRASQGWLGHRRWKLLGTSLSAERKSENSTEVVVSLPLLHPSQIAASYRELRRSFEVNSDEPGGADFYYGEMEMRRLNPDASVLEWLIVTLYWIFSGYGLREFRPLMALLTLLVLGGLAASMWGFEEGEVPMKDGLLFSLKAIVSLVPGQRTPAPELVSAVGRAIEIAITVFGTLFIALFALAVRNRVKRR